MRFLSQRLNLPAIVALTATVFALAVGKASASDGEPPMALAVRDAIVTIAPETYPEFVWTFIRRGESVKIKGKGDGKIEAIFALSGADDAPILTLTSLKTTGMSGSPFEQICTESGQCRNLNHGYYVSEAAKAKGGNKGGNGKGKGKNK